MLDFIRTVCYTIIVPRDGGLPVLNRLGRYPQEADRWAILTERRKAMYKQELIEWRDRVRAEYDQAMEEGNFAHAWELLRLIRNLSQSIAAN